ncbi:polysaccharide biosynthesis/export family protein [Paracoccaceae bacterium GXU_MW_L88]
MSAKSMIAVAAVSALSACGLPSSGPSKEQLLSSDARLGGDAFVVPLDNGVVQMTQPGAGLSFSGNLQGAAEPSADVIRPGDVLTVTVWENVDNGLLANIGQKVTMLEALQVDEQGRIFVPYAGAINVAGDSPATVRRKITAALQSQTPDPQVEVRRDTGDGATVAVIGRVNAQQVVPVTSSSNTLTEVIASAGGISIEPQMAMVRVVRNGSAETVWLQDIYDNPRFDIAIQPGDRVIVEQDRRSFTSLGQTSGQREVDFTEPNLTLIEALGLVGGLNGNTADATGVFVLREESAAVANAVLRRNDIVSPQRIVYALDLSEPSGLFLGRDFFMRDDDLLYVTEAPYVKWARVITSITAPATQIDSIRNVAD